MRACWLAAPLAVPFLVGPGELNYDLVWALTWGEDVLAGRTPDFGVNVAPTPHPLTNGLAVVLSIFSTPVAIAGMQSIAILSFAALLVIVVLVGRELGGWAAGIVAAVPLAISPAFLTAAAYGYQDVTAAALILAAVLVELRRPRQGTGVLVLLAVAGLLRPEAWGLAAAYWLYLAVCMPMGTRLRLGALALAGPAGWALMDLAITGEPFGSLTQTHEGTAALGRPTGLGEVPGALRLHLDRMLGVAVLAGALAGVAAELLLPRSRVAIRVPLAAGVLMGLAFAALGAAELSLLSRYLLVPAALLCVFFGLALCGWRDLAASRARTAWIAGAAVLALAAVALAPRQIDRASDQLAGQAADDTVVEALYDLVDEPATRAATARCGPPGVSHRVARPFVALEAGVPAGEIVVLGLERGPVDAVVTPIAPRSLAFVSRAADAPETPPRLAGSRRLTANGMWELRVREGCG